MPPTGIRVASTLSWIVGVLTILVSLPLGMLASGRPRVSVLPFLIYALAGSAVCVGAYLVRRQRRLGALLVVLAWGSPTVIALLSHQTPATGSFLLFVAVLLIAANWKHLH